MAADPYGGRCAGPSTAWSRTTPAPDWPRSRRRPSSSPVSSTPRRRPAYGRALAGAIPARPVRGGAGGRPPAAGRGAGGGERAADRAPRRRGAGWALMAEWRWIRIFADQFERCGLVPGEVVAVLVGVLQPPGAGGDGAPGRAAPRAGRCSTSSCPTPANDQPVAIRSTGASRALQGNPSVLAASGVGRVGARLHGRGPAPRAGARRHPRRRRPGPHDLQRAPGELRALPVRPRARRTAVGRAHAAPRRRRDHAGDIAGRHGPDRATWPEPSRRARPV